MGEKAYDLKLLGEKLKEQGLDLAEDAVKIIYIAFMEWIEASAKISDNKIDDFVLLIRKNIDDIVLPTIDKIDGKEG